MMPCRLRSLLLAVFALSNCITWTASRHHFTHNVSGHRSRHRRQGAGLFLSASYVLPGGEGSGWGEWGEVSPCSRTCGGGVASQKRICLQIGSDGQPQCTGGDTKYFSCETQDCPAGAEDFRSMQCAHYNNESFRGIKYKWEPYTKAPNPCELNCMPHGERFYYRHKAKVIDGTRCNDDSFDVCVNGTCQPVGCDMMLGSNAREDKCRNCRGNGVNCHTANGILNTQEQRKGYNDMLLIPEGATSIYIMEVRPSNNYLALRAKNGTYYLNGDYHIDFPRSMTIAGALWYYERSQQGFAAPDKLRCLGPTNEPLYLSLLLQDENVGIEYEYSLPSERAPPPTKKYNWVHENFTPCSVPCAGGFQTRNVTCRSSEELETVEDGLCDEGLKPPTNQTCNTQACPAHWVEGLWSQCSKRCGKGGTRSREVRCEKIITSGFPSIVSDKECFDILGPKPELYQECNINASCPTWFAGPWKPCNKLCGEGKQTRQVVCYQKNAGRIEVLEDEECAEDRPQSEQSCTLQLCDGVDWVVTNWSGCDTCLSTIRTRIALCATKDRKVVNSSFCEYHPKPVLQEPCNVVPPCQVQWYATQWSKCSVECGKGVQTRQVFCGRFENDSVVIVNDSLCADLPKYNDTKSCEVPKEKCPSKWYASPWSACTKKCGGGERHRRVMCLRGNQPANDCSGELVIDSSEICNDGPCNIDQTLPLNPNSTPIMDDEEEDCIDEEDYPEVGIDIDTSDLRTTLDDKMFSDGTSTEDGSGMEFPVSIDLESTLSFDEKGSGFELTSSADEELFVKSLMKKSSSALDTDTTEITDVSGFTTESIVTEQNATTDYSTSDTDYENTDDSTITDISEETLETDSTGSSETDETSTAESTMSTETDETTETRTDVTDDTSEGVSTESSETDDASEFTTDTGSDVTVTTIAQSPTVTDSSKETSETEPTESSEIDETSLIWSSSSIDLTTETGSDVTETITEVTDLKTKETTLSSKSLTTPVKDETKKTTIPPPTDESTIIDIENTSETGTTESSETEDTSLTGSSSSTELTSETESDVIESTITEVTDLTETKLPTTSDRDVTTRTSVPPPTDKFTTDRSEETSETVSTESSTTEFSSTQTDETTELENTDLTSETDTSVTDTSVTDTSVTDTSVTDTSVTDTSVTDTSVTDTSVTDTSVTDTSATDTSVTETKIPKATESSTVTETSEATTTDTKTPESGSTESLTTYNIKTESTATSHSTEIESTVTEISTELEPSATTVISSKPESTLTEESSEASSTLSSMSKVTSLADTVSSSTETLSKETTEEITESPEPSSTIEISNVRASELETSSSTEAIPIKNATKETTEPVTIVSTETESSSTEPLTEKTTIAVTTMETESSSESTQSTISKLVTTEETTEFISTVSEVEHTDLSSITEASTTPSSEVTTEPSSTESTLSSSDKSSTEFTELTSSTEPTLEDKSSTLSTESEETSPTTEVTTLSTQSLETSETTSESAVEASSKVTSEVSTTEATASSVGISIRDWKTTLIPPKPICKKRKLQCSKTTFGCCPDRKTPANGPFDEGCPKPKTCKESEFGCCPDEVSPALGRKYEGCPIMPCAETLFGCCLSDNRTAAEGNDQEGCPPKPPACKSSTYGCCEDGETEATGLDSLGCPEYSTTTQTEADTETTSEKETTYTEGTITVAGGCAGSTFGCCSDNETTASGPDEQGCPCNVTKFGCCPDGVTPANGTQMEGCVMSCNSSTFGCCPDGKTPAHGHGHEGCCLLYPFGCCPDNYKPAEGPHLEGCGCQHARFGCCPDNVTYARGSNNEGCGCQNSAHGCCPDRHTEASGPNFDGCGCHTYQFGCCPDGVTVSKGPGLQGCHCRQSKYGCCDDGETAASGPDKQGCDCSSSKYGCCPDGVTEAKGSKFLGCTDIPLNRQAACSLSTDRGSCRNYSVHWYYDLEYGGCSRFWYGGCEGNGNRFNSKEECEDVCVQPSPQDTCKLPKVKGACAGYNVRWYYDSEREQCSQFVFGGCLGNANNFDSRELCQAQCEPTRTTDQCNLPIDRGSCSGNFGRWGFNAETRRCEQFIWGGCEGNSNRFGSEAACIQRCDPPGAAKPQCTQQQDVGNCIDKEAVWSFSQSENRCVPFYYTGCGGNDNRFDNEQSCIEACPSSYIPDLCTLPAETGDCANYRERWYFDTSEQRCRQFYYGGCGGNSNNFASQIECENRCTDFTPTTTVQPPELRTHGTAENISASCLLEKDPGPCTQMSTRWAYDYNVGKCTHFQYGGCGGNINNFPSEETCEYYCKPVQDICQLPMLSGPCEDSIMSWFYDASIDACNQFTYGGCEGNDNRFETRDDCERRCRTGPPPEARTTTTTTTPAPATTVKVQMENRLGEDIAEVCKILSELEECTVAGSVWYYDVEHSECVAHENKDTGMVCRHTGTFATEEACQRSCGAFRNINVCRYSLDPGPCQNFAVKYYFNESSGNCHEFVYGGCHGGPNRFSTFEECLQVCRPETDPCKQSPEPGNCLERYEMWYYDYYRDSCSRFTYTGCGGNNNRFETRADCEGRCRQRPAVVTTTTTTIEVSHTTTTTAVSTHTEEPVGEECRTPDSLSACGINVTAYYYDSTRKVCVESNIGACRYSNSYRSDEECERKCGAFKNLTVLEVCEARLDTGPCHESIPKFYWDFASGRCQPYAYGGCKGGPNRFSSNEECEEVCGATGPAPACLQPVDTGSYKCGRPTRRWRYSVHDANCIGFVYQGCGGNDNNFINFEECAERCKVSRHNGSNDVQPACSLYENECSRLECAYGVEQRRDSDGCVRCTCKAPKVDCEPMRLECDTLRCPYGIRNFTDENKCERCTCFEDPCLGNNCSVGQQCVAIAYRDSVTQKPHYSAQCRPITPEPPNCDRFNDECSRLQCGELGVQRVRTVEGCERCSCVQVQIDCEPLRHECNKLKCTYGMDRKIGFDGCERCRCTGPPCENKECPEGDRCVTVPYRDPITQDMRYSAECRTVNKTGYCPVREVSVTAVPCRRDCNDDADCRGVAKCCRRGCSQLCLEPDEPTAATPPLPYTTTHKPDIPESPRVNPDTEPEVSGTEGGKAVLRCLFHGNPPPKITWTRGEITIDADEGRYRLLSDGALEIVSLYRNDSGVYICIADNGLGTARQEVHLQVKDPVTSPMSIAGEPNAVLTGELGRPLVIRCLVYGYPPPTVYWLRGLNGPMVPFSSSLYEARLPGVLLIRRLTAETVGEYLCQAYNGVGRPATKLFVVQAYQTDDSPYISKYIVPRERPETETVRLRIIDAATQRTTHTEGTTTTSSTTTELTTPESDVEFEKPLFHVAVRTHISAPQTTLTAGSELSLPCEVDGYPDPEVYWTKDNVRLVARDNLWISGTTISRLTIPRLAVSDSGVYGCHAGNAYSSHYSTVQINVQGLTIPAKCTDNPFFANCHLIVRSKFCQHKYYSVFCCKSCMEAGQLNPDDVDVQGDQAWNKAK